MTMNRFIFPASFLVFSCIAANAQKDTTFWFVAPEVAAANVSFDVPIRLVLTSYLQSATVTVSQPANPDFEVITVNLAANAAQTVALSSYLDLIENHPANQVLNKGLYISSTTPISAYYEVVSSECNCNPEIFVLKGRHALGNKFMIPGQNFFNNSDYGTFLPTPYSAFDIVATEDSTIVTVKPKKNIVGHAAGVEFAILLNKGQTYSATATSQLGTNHLVGSTVESNRPVAVTIKDDLMEIYNPLLFANLGGDQIFPTIYAGNNYIFIKGEMVSTFDKIFITGIENNTMVNINSSNTTLQAEATYQFNLPTGATYVSSDKPVIIAQTSGFGNELGLEVIPPLDCGGSDTIKFIRTNFNSLFLNILVQTGGEDDFTFNGSTTIIQASDFTTVPNTGGNWKFAKKSISTATLESGAQGTVTNSSSLFHLGMIHGTSTEGCRFGYFSSINNAAYEATEQISTCESSVTLLDGTVVTQNGTYQTLVNNPFGCDSLVVVQVTFSPTFSSSNSVSICNGDTYEIAGNTYNTTGIYIDTVQISANCDNILTTTLTVLPVPTTTISAEMCSQGSTTINGETFTQPGIYLQTLTTTMGCDSILTIQLNAEDTLRSYQYIVLCPDQNYEFQAETYGISTVLTENAVSYFGCDSIHTIFLTILPEPTLSLLTPGEACPGDSIIFAFQSTLSDTLPYQTNWSFAPNCAHCDTAETVMQPHTPYCLTLGYLDGVCTVTDCADIRAFTEDIFIPNAFTPNDDGNNDTFGIYASECVETILEFNIFDRWGEHLYTASNLSVHDDTHHWNGIYRGKPCSSDTYVYYAVVKYKSGATAFFEGDVTLLR